MIITCQECDSRFVLDDKLIKPTGTKVRCSSCKHVFKAFPKPPKVEEEPEELLEEAAPAAAAPPSSGGLGDGDDLADELDRELDRLFGPDDDIFGGEESATEAKPQAPVVEEAPAPKAAAPSSEPVEEIDLDDLNFDDLELASEGEDVPVAEELDLSDLDLSFDDAPTSEAAPVSEGAAEESLDFSDLEASLDDAPADAASTFGEELDLSELQSVLDEAPEEVAPASDAPDLDLDLSLSGDDEVEMVGAEGSLDLDDDLDFSDLEASLSEDAPAEASPEPGIETSVETIDFGEMDLSLDDGSEPMAQPVSDELEFSLDDGDDALALDGTGELELSLDLDDEPAVEAGAAGVAFGSEEELMMDLDLALDDEEPMADPVKATEEELDLSDLEGLLAEDPDEATGLELGSDDEIELELDLDFESASGTEELEPMSQIDDDFSDIEEMLEKDTNALDTASEVDEAVDLSLELDLASEMGSEGMTQTASPDLESAQVAAMQTMEMDDMAAMDQAIEETAKKPKAKKGATARRGSGLKIALTLLFVLVLLSMILFSVYALKDQIRNRTGVAIPTIGVLEELREDLAGLGIPYVSELIKPPAKDPAGTLLLSTQDITNRFVSSSTDGELFVITGNVKSGYSDLRNSIRLLGRIYVEAGREVQSKEFFAGNILTDDELKSLTMEEIDQKLKTTLGANNRNARVRPGQVIPFMVVFSKLPDNLSQFTVEVSGSKSGAAIK